MQNKGILIRWKSFLIIIIIVIISSSSIGSSVFVFICIAAFKTAVTSKVLHKKKQETQQQTEFRIKDGKL